MVKTMITQKDIKALTFHRTRFGRIATWIVFILPIFCFIMGALNLHVAARIGRYSGHDLGSLFHSWFKGVEVDKQYTGLYLKAMDRLTTALLGFGTGFILSIVAFGLHKIDKDVCPNILDIEA